MKGVVAAVFDVSMRSALDEVLAKMAQGGWTKLVEALRSILSTVSARRTRCASLWMTRIRLSWGQFCGASSIRNP